MAFFDSALITVTIFQNQKFWAPPNLFTTLHFESQTISKLTWTNTRRFNCSSEMEWKALAQTADLSDKVRYGKTNWPTQIYILRISIDIQKKVHLIHKSGSSLLSDRHSPRCKMKLPMLLDDNAHMCVGEGIFPDSTLLTRAACWIPSLQGAHGSSLCSHNRLTISWGPAATLSWRWDRWSLFLNLNQMVLISTEGTKVSSTRFASIPQASWLLSSAWKTRKSELQSIDAIVSWLLVTCCEDETNWTLLGLCMTPAIVITHLPMKFCSDMMVHCGDGSSIHTQAEWASGRPHRGSAIRNEQILVQIRFTPFDPKNCHLYKREGTGSKPIAFDCEVVAFD